MPAWVAPVPAKKPFTLRPQDPEQPIVAPTPVVPFAVPVALNVEPPIVPVAVPVKVEPPAVADRLTLTVVVLKFPTSEAEFNTPGATLPSARVGWVAPIMLYVYVTPVGMLAAGVGKPTTV